MTIGTLNSLNPRNGNSISVINSKFLPFSSMNTLLAILKVTDVRRDVKLAGGLNHQFPWRQLLVFLVSRLETFIHIVVRQIIRVDRRMAAIFSITLDKNFMLDTGLKLEMTSPETISSAEKKILPSSWNLALKLNRMRGLQLFY